MIVALIVFAFSCAWVVMALLGIQTFSKWRSLSAVRAADPAPWPKLSVIIPALDEASTIESALATLLASTYPHLEVIVIDDRSTDATGAIIDRVAARDSRVRAVHITELPAGWLGKVHALHRGVEMATGEFLLFTDADVHFAPGCFEQAIRAAVAEQLDQLAVLPAVHAKTLLERAVLVSFGISFALLVRPHRVGQPGSKAFVGVGAFNLVRRAAFDRTEGLAWLRMEVADDVGLGKMIVDSGARAGWMSGFDLLWLEWYPSLGAFIKGLEKNTYGVFSNFRPSIFAAKIAVVFAMMSSPFVAIASPIPWVFASGIAAFVAVGVLFVYGARKSSYGLREALLAPLVGCSVMMVALLRSAWACWRDGGIRWRGTLYPVAQLRDGQRVRL